MAQRLRYGICIPTLNAGNAWHTWLEQSRSAVSGAQRTLIVDSSSSDETPTLAARFGWEVMSIAREEFDHGGTRQHALEYLDDCEIVVFLTQDAVVADPHAIAELVGAFDDARVGAAFGRQLPHPGATPLARHARLFNYPARSYQVSQADIARMGIKTAFLSNSFAAYRREALLASGGFATNTILSEDMLAGANLLKQGWTLAYCANARVHHSHNYSLKEEFQRYFDIGVFHYEQGWLLAWLGRAEGEGARFVRSETRYLLRHAPWRLPEAALRTCLKYSGYQLGLHHLRLTWRLKRRLSMNKGFW
ncbi:glycosyltransferase family 2 protein [Vreelandella sp. EE7]